MLALSIPILCEVSNDTSPRVFLIGLGYLAPASFGACFLSLISSLATNVVFLSLLLLILYTTLVFINDVIFYTYMSLYDRFVTLQSFSFSIARKFLITLSFLVLTSFDFF